MMSFKCMVDGRLKVKGSVVEANWIKVARWWKKL